MRILSISGRSRCSVLRAPRCGISGTLRLTAPHQELRGRRSACEEGRAVLKPLVRRSIEHPIAQPQIPVKAVQTCLSRSAPASRSVSWPSSVGWYSGAAGSVAQSGRGRCVIFRVNVSMLEARLALRRRLVERVVGARQWRLRQRRTGFRHPRVSTGFASATVSGNFRSGSG